MHQILAGIGSIKALSVLASFSVGLEFRRLTFRDLPSSRPVSSLHELPMHARNQTNNGEQAGTGSLPETYTDPNYTTLLRTIILPVKYGF